MSHIPRKGILHHRLRTNALEECSPAITQSSYSYIFLHKNS